MEESNRGVLKFSQLSTSIEPGFWYKLSELKLEVDKLDEYERKIWGSYKKIGGKSLFEVGLSSFNNTISIPENSYNTSIAKGYCINKNTLETYKSCDKSELACQYGELLKSQMRNGDVLDDPSLMSSFILLTHADLKKYNFLYWFAFLVPQDITVRFVESSPLGAQLTSESIEQLFGGHSQLTIINRSFFAVVKSGNEIKVYTLKEFSSIFTTIDDEKCSYYFGFCDCSSGDSKQPSWYLRNFLAFIQLHFSNKCRLINVICLREKETSNLLQLEVAEGDNRLEKWIGWKRKSDGKFGPISVCLGESMDPVRLAENGRRLNLSLMKWRLAPLLDVGVVRSSSFLLLGAGTLGCSVALNLTAWGAERITFVDSGRVSYSNPGRQFLFTFEDSSGRPAALKAQAAANRLKAICPNMIARGEVLEIAMPGHSGCCDSSEQLSTLIGQHDVIFLLTDTRESRWLPTLLARHHNKIAITAALGFDSYLVMRHGSHLADKPLGCYFCNDVTAPGNSTVDRTLDQQCTVTRPGVASLAAALAVELAVSVLQHPKKGAADWSDETVLGAVPHSIRGYLSTFTHILPSTPAFESCVACSDKVLSAYEKDGRLFLRNVFESNAFLENLTGIAELLNDPNIDEIVELDDEEDF